MYESLGPLCLFNSNTRLFVETLENGDKQKEENTNHLLSHHPDLFLCMCIHITMNLNIQITFKSFDKTLQSSLIMTLPRPTFLLFTEDFSTWFSISFMPQPSHYSV